MKNLFGLILCVVCDLSGANAQTGYKLFSAGTNLATPKGKGGFVEADGTQLVIFCDQGADDNICLVRLSASGTTLWSKKYRITGVNEDITSSVIDAGDSYILVGNTAVGLSITDGLLLKVRKSDGVLLASRQFGGSSRDVFLAGTMTSPVSFVVCGYTLNPSFGPSNKGDGILVEFSFALDTLRTKRLGFQNMFDKIDAIAMAANGDILVACTKSPVTSGIPITDSEDLVYLRLSPSWSLVSGPHVYDHSAFSSYETPSAIFEGPDGSIYIFSRFLAVDKTAMLKFSGSGVLLETKIFHAALYTGARVFGSDVFVFGQSENGKAIVSSFDPTNLALPWTKLYDFGSSSAGILHSVASSGGLLLGFGSSYGHTKAFSFTATLGGDMAPCTGSDLSILSTNFASVPRSGILLTGLFPYAGTNVTVQTEAIVPTEGGCQNTTLPIELLSLQAMWSDGRSVVSWTTASEVDVNRFVVERSFDAFHFDSIASVPSMGDSYTLRGYEVFDEIPFAWEEVYYRLRTIDNDGSTELSRVVVLEDQEREDLFAFPNPASHNVVIRGLGEHEVFLLRNSLGQTVHSGTTSILYVDSFPDGLYTIVLPSTGRSTTLVVGR